MVFYFYFKIKSNPWYTWLFPLLKPKLKQGFTFFFSDEKMTMTSSSEIKTRLLFFILHPLKLNKLFILKTTVLPPLQSLIIWRKIWRLVLFLFMHPLSFVKTKDNEALPTYFYTNKKTLNSYWRRGRLIVCALMLPSFRPPPQEIPL